MTVPGAKWAMDQLLEENAQLLAENQRLRDRAVCSGCGQDVDEGGACRTVECTDGEMIPASGLPGALLASCEKFAEERSEWRFDWEALRAEAKGLEAENQRLRDALTFYAERRNLHTEWSGEIQIRDRGQVAAAALAAVRVEDE